MKIITNSQIKLIQSLKKKEERYKRQLFWTEGFRSIESLIENGLKSKFIVVDQESKTILFPSQDVLFCSSKNISKIKQTKTFPGVGGVFHMPQQVKVDSQTIIALQSINDPGNLGTIIRTALWFGIDQMIVDSYSVDPYHEKVVRGTMGAIGKMKFRITDDLFETLSDYQQQDYKVIAADLSGESLSSFICPKKSILLMGNEAHGLSKQAREMADQLIHIKGSGLQESLNVAVAFGIIMHQFFDVSHNSE